MKKHTVKQGENLSSIAQKHGLASWKEIYDASCNASFRTKRPDPGKVKEGDIVVIPPNALEVAQKRLDALNKIKQDQKDLYNQIKSRIEKDQKEFNSLRSTVDILGAFATGLVSMVSAGYQAMAKTGVELAKANTKLATTALTHGPKTVKSLIEIDGKPKEDPLETTGEEGLAFALSKIVVKSFLDMQTPGYWTSRVTGDPNQTFNSHKAQLDNWYNIATANINKRIVEASLAVKNIRDNQKAIKENRQYSKRGC